MTAQHEMLLAVWIKALREVDALADRADMPWEALAALQLLDKVDALEKEIGPLRMKNRGTLANNLCPDHRDKQMGKSCLACEIERLRGQLDALHAALGKIPVVIRNAYLSDSNQAVINN